MNTKCLFSSPFEMTNITRTSYIHTGFASVYNADQYYIAQEELQKHFRHSKMSQYVYFVYKEMLQMFVTRAFSYFYTLFYFCSNPLLLKKLNIRSKKKLDVIITIYWQMHFK